MRHRPCGGAGGTNQRAVFRRQPKPANVAKPPVYIAPAPTGKRPGAYWVYVAYCTYLTLIYAVAIVAGVLLIVFAEPIAASDTENSPPELFMFMGGVVAVVCLPFLIISAIGPFLPKNKFGWIYAIVLMAFGLTSGCTIIFAVILLIFWLQEPAKQYYGMTPRVPRQY